MSGTAGAEVSRVETAGGAATRTGGDRAGDEASGGEVGAPAAPRSRLDLALLAAAAAWATVALVAGWRWHGRALDDFFITFRYAQNLADGLGLVFNPGEHAFGTTAPGYALLLGALAALTRLPAHQLATACTVVCLPLVALLATRSGERRRAEVLAGGTLLVTCRFLWVHQGGELPVVLALLAAAALASTAGRPRLAGALAAAAVWCRPDALAGAAVLGVLAWRTDRRGALRYAVWTAVLVAAGLGAAWWWFGHVLPTTLEAKRVQAAWHLAQWPSGWGFWPGGYAAVQRQVAGPWAAPLFVVGALGQLPLFRRGGRVVRTLAGYGLAVSAAYPFLGVPFYSWYALPALVACWYGVAFALGAVARALGAQRRIVVRAGGFLALAVATVLLLAYPARRAAALLGTTPPPAREDLYQQTGEWIASHLPPEARVASLEVGTIGYFSRRAIRDPLGLVSPELLPMLRRRNLLGVFRHLPAEAIVVSSYAPISLAEQPWFRRYALAAEIRQAGSAQWARVYTLRPGMRPPGERPASAAADG